MLKKRRIVGAAAGCAVAVATLLGTPSVDAEECINCPIDQPPGAFIKSGATVNAFYKINLPDNAFMKVGEDFPFWKCC